MISFTCLMNFTWHWRQLLIYEFVSVVLFFYYHASAKPKPNRTEPKWTALSPPFNILHLNLFFPSPFLYRPRKLSPTLGRLTSRPTASISFDFNIFLKFYLVYFIAK